MRSPKISHDGPTTGLIHYWIGRIGLQLTGWDTEGDIPPGGKFVVIGAPHTSNWDFPLGLAVSYVYRLKVSWMGKHTLFKWPLGEIMRRLGGIPVNRENPVGVVDQIAGKLRESSRLAILLTPSGTRKKRDHWRSGFYRIAVAAQVPILCGYLDYKRKKARLDFSFTPTGNIKKDMDRIREFYDGVRGKHPELTTRVRLEDEGSRSVIFTEEYGVDSRNKS